MKGAFFVVAFLALSLFEVRGDDAECTQYDHPDYGCVGHCIDTSACPGGKYLSNYCPSYGVSVKCCFTVDTDVECATHYDPQDGDVGHCINQGQCPGSNYISNLCPTKPWDVKCCFSHPTDTCSAGGTCGAEVQAMACEIMQARNANRITLLTVNPSGVNDGADAYSNIQDTCNGGMAKRSSYSCSSGTAPGGYICLTRQTLDYIQDLIDANTYVQVNSIAGACHSTTSYHYQGRATDLQVNGGDAYWTWQNICSANGAIENLGPGDAGHDTHTHCAI